VYISFVRDGNSSMKKLKRSWLIVILVGMVSFTVVTQIATANFKGPDPDKIYLTSDQQPDKTPLPTSSPVSAEIPSPQARVLPPVGKNAGLVIGASVLVLIIIGGVLGAQLRRKH
jgi:hypothetical protein